MSGTLCNELQAYILDYIHHEVDGELRGRLEVHLTDCTNCQDECTAEATITHLLQRHCHEKAPFSLQSALREKYGVSIC